MVDRGTIWSDYRHEATHVPEFLPQRCVHEKVPSARCQRCVDSCPQGAWQLNEEALEIDVLACDGCGLCEPACPEAAISFNVDYPIKSYKKAAAVFLSCAKATDASQQVMPCIHSVGVLALLAMYQRGVRFLIVTQGSCEHCHHYDGISTIVQTVSDCNQMLRSRQAEPFYLVNKATSVWNQWFASLASEGEAMSRRGFLRRGLNKAIETVQEQTPQASVDMAALLHGLPTATHAARFPFVPQVDTAHCNLCGACVRLCPHQSLVDDGDYFQLHPEHCTGCGICEDVCDKEAITVSPWGEKQQTQLALHPKQCTACGATFSVFAEQESDNDFCSICQLSNKNQNLYQVL